MLKYVVLFLVSANLFANKSDYAIEELRQEVSDLKHAIHTFRVDLQILDEKMSKQTASSKTSNLSEQLTLLEKKITYLEKVQEKITADLKQLASHANQTSTALGECQQKNGEISQRLGEISKLKSTLTSISQAMTEKRSASSSKTYKVQNGDSLEKIARKHQTSVSALKKLNHLENDRIIVGQEIEIPDESR